ncbi:MAG: hypothetical protein PHD05_06175 [Sphaerochaetaceae bacterium]|nr:hypothetical protein [Sphaerochaetaceae bacterium]
MNEIDQLQFKDWVPRIESELNDIWVSLYKSDNNDCENSVIYSCLLKKGFVSAILDNYSWDFHISDTRGREGIIPLLIKREFYGIKKEYWEISEELRLFFNLFHDNNKFIYLDDNGDEEEVISITDNEVKIKKIFLKEYLFAKDYVFIQFYDLVRYSPKGLEDLELEPIDGQKKESNFAYCLSLNKYDFFDDKRKTISRLLGKSIIVAPKDFKSNLFNKTETYEEFDIGVDKDGNKKSFTCNEQFLSNYFGANEGNPHYLTPVFFRKNVLDKYYSDTKKYLVRDGYLSCQHLWGLRMDNSHQDYVAVFLGDLGHLTNKEQKYWKNFNIITDEKISSTCFKRSFMAEFCDPDSADLFFKQKFSEFQTKWHKKYGWHLFLPLNSEDQHHLAALRLLTKNTQEEFDLMVLSLTKILIDSINIKEIKSELIGEDADENYKKIISSDLIIKKEDKSIEIFRKYLAQKHKLQFPEMIQFLRDLQNLRSTGAAHRKGAQYELIKKRFGLNENFKEVFENILINSIKILNTLSSKKYDLLEGN